MPEPTRRRTPEVTAATGMAAAAVAVPVPLPVRGAAASPRRPSYGRIDTHHAVPRRMRQWAVEPGILPPTGGFLPDMAGRVLFGTGRPADSAREVTLDTADLDRDSGLDRRAHQALARDNALRLFPRPAGGRR